MGEVEEEKKGIQLSQRGANALARLTWRSYLEFLAKIFIAGQFMRLPITHEARYVCGKLTLITINLGR